MTESDIRRRLTNNDMTSDEVEDVIAELADRHNSEERDRRAEELYKE